MYQKKGVGIGLGVAPVLCEILLAKVDRFIESSFEGTDVVNIFRCV